MYFFIVGQYRSVPRGGQRSASLQCHHVSEPSFELLSVSESAESKLVGRVIKSLLLSLRTPCPVLSLTRAALPAVSADELHLGDDVVGLAHFLLLLQLQLFGFGR